jgi:hypothetical protein
MLRPDEFTPAFLALLVAAGWEPQRRVDVDPWISQLASEGFEPSPRGLAILESLGGLVVRLPPAGLMPFEQELVFDPVEAATGEHDRAEEWEQQLGVKFFPLAEETHFGNPIWLASDGAFYYGRAVFFGLYHIGDTLARAMDQLAFSAKSPTLRLP